MKKNKKTKLKIASWNIGRKTSRLDAINIMEWMTDKHIDVLLTAYRELKKKNNNAKMDAFLKGSRMPKVKYTLVKTNNVRVVNYKIPKCICKHA